MLPPFHMAYALGGDTLLLDCVQPRASLWWLKINEVTLFGQFGTVQYVVRQGMLLVHLVVHGISPSITALYDPITTGMKGL